MTETIAFVARHGYALLFVWILAEQGALPLPSMPLLLAAGALARNGTLNPFTAVAVCIGASVLADIAWFQVGRIRGTKVLRFLCRVAIEPDSCVRRTENAFIRYGMRSLLVSRFIPGLNAVAAPLAGNSGESIWRFLAFDILGALLWATSLIGLGYLFSDQLEMVAAYASRTGAGLVILLASMFVIWILWKYIQRQRFLRELHANRITVDELRGRLDAGEEFFIVDLRGALDSTTGSIPGATRMSAEDLTSRHHEIPRDRDIILFCS